MGRFDFLPSEKSRRAARLAVEEMAAGIERQHGRGTYGTLLVEVGFGAHGEPVKVTVTQGTTVTADQLLSGDK